jgi:predicted ATPase
MDNVRVDDVLLEREFEARMLREVIASAITGRGGAVLIEGEAGIGKTRLLMLAREHAGRPEPRCCTRRRTRRR